MRIHTHIFIIVKHKRVRNLSVSKIGGKMLVRSSLLRFITTMGGGWWHVERERERQRVRGGGEENGLQRIYTWRHWWFAINTMASVIFNSTSGLHA